MSRSHPIKRILEPLRRSLRLLIGRAVLTVLREDSGLLLAQADRLADETGDDLELMGQYGFFSVPLPGAEGVVVSIGGDRSHGIVIATQDRRYRPSGAALGDAGLHDHRNQIIHLKGDQILIKSPSKVTIEAPAIKLQGDAQVTGKLTVDGDLTAKGNVALGDGAALFVKLSDGSNATKVKAK